MHGDSIFVRKKKFLRARGKEVRYQNVSPLIDSILNAEVLGVHSWIVTIAKFGITTVQRE